MANGVLSAFVALVRAAAKAPEFPRGVVDYEPPGAQAMFGSYAAQRRREHTSVADMLDKSAA
jgi:hypothetical protein